MKQVYLKPALWVVEIQQSHIICDSDWGVINPGDPNQPAGAKSNSWDNEGYNVWDDDWSE